MKLLISRKGIRTKEANEVGKKKVTYFRGKDFTKWIKDNPDLIKKRAHKALALVLDGNVASDDDDIEMLGDALVQVGMIQRAVYNPMGEESATKKWPDRLTRSNRDYDNDGFYIIIYEGSKTLQHIALTLIMIGVFALTMWKAWPLWAKIGVWYIAVFFLTILFIISIVRLVVFTSFWCCGYELWIMPNFWDDTAGLIECFLPLYSFEKRKDGLMMLLVRFFSIIMLGTACWQISQTHSISDFTEFAKDNFLEFVEYGEHYLTHSPQGKEALPSLEEIRAETADQEHDEEILIENIPSDKAEKAEL